MADDDPRASDPPEVLTNPTYELFILVLSILSIVNLVLILPFSPLPTYAKEVIFIIDGVLTLIFLGDFASRLVRANSKRGYFIHDGGWLDFLGSLPLLRIARLFRIWRTRNLLKQYTPSALLRWVLDDRAESALYVVVLLTIIVLEICGSLEYRFEHAAPHATIVSAGDSLWWGIVTITTVGYGDMYPVTTAGRIVGCVVLVVGVALFATFTGFLANAFLSPKTPQPAEPGSAEAQTPHELVEGFRALLEEQEQRTRELRIKLAEVERHL
jgi:voltage-gated potassium channel Kch